MDRAFQRIRSLMLRDTFYSVPPTYWPCILKDLNASRIFYLLKLNY